jgi:hypothetical protein
MAYFWLTTDDDRQLQIYFSGIINAELLNEGLATFDYEPEDEVGLYISKFDVGDEVWDIFLQRTNLAT